MSEPDHSNDDDYEDTALEPPLKKRKRFDSMKWRKKNRERATKQELLDVLAAIEESGWDTEAQHEAGVHHFICVKDCSGNSQAEGTCFVQCANCTLEGNDVINSVRDPFVQDEWLCCACINKMTQSVSRQQRDLVKADD